ncbi:DUF742 domain-containing protein [Aquihabitans sp. G128]|uniref:DUF742 domain-containing protein n=1 Tax=Aquihabitans sp. G128 TaxID=2849779 RepID=UPI001C22E073|nr:DUF742 domain-containing protein [Aquihabitans sp. G128]QXC62115.1 DUF742 domain-containing protein [Aquihabitans sp. G128]
MSSFGDAGDGLRVRPYAITGGRTRARTELQIEAIVYRTPMGEQSSALPLERGQILSLLATPLSTAEISARLRLPLGVTRVILGDLIDEGYVAVNSRSATGRPDLRLLERVLDGLQAL